MLKKFRCSHSTLKGQGAFCSWQLLKEIDFKTTKNYIQKRISQLGSEQPVQVWVRWTNRAKGHLWETMEVQIWERDKVVL